MIPPPVCPLKAGLKNGFNVYGLPLANRAQVGG